MSWTPARPSVAGSCRSPCTKRTADPRRSRSAANCGVSPITSTPVTRVAPASSATKQIRPCTLHMQPTSRNDCPGACSRTIGSRSNGRRSSRRRRRWAAIQARLSTAADPSLDAVIDELRRLLGDGAVLEPSAAYEQDATEGRGVRGRADAVVLPSSAQDVARALAWCYEHDVPITPRGGGSGYAGGAVPRDGGVVLGTERLTAVRALDPLLWRATFEAGLPT